VTEIPDLVLDADGWFTADDVYDAFFASVRAPIWHGRNLNALRDSIGTGQINEIEVPYRLVVVNTSKASADAVRMLNLFAEVVEQLRIEGCPVEMNVTG
jgi:RNAse (barnase) inhibitor barstar